LLLLLSRLFLGCGRLRCLGLLLLSLLLLGILLGGFLGRFFGFRWLATTLVAAASPLAMLEASKVF
jgi:hypothetical protein